MDLAFERGFQRAAEAAGAEDSEAALLRLLPNKDWVPFGKAMGTKPASTGAFGGGAEGAAAFYLKPSLMPVVGSCDWECHPLYQKDLAFVKKDGAQEVRINKQICALWGAQELLDFAARRGCELDVANAVTALHRVAKAADRWQVRKDPRLAALAAQASAAVVLDGSPRDLAKVQWAMGRLHASTSASTSGEGLLAAIGRRRAEFEPQSLSNILWSLAFSDHPLDQLLAEFTREIHRCDPQALSNVAWACARRLLCCAPVMEAISRCAVLKTPQFDVQGLANLVWSFATLKREDGPLFAAVAGQALGAVWRWGPRHLANLAWAFAKAAEFRGPLLAAVAAEALKTVEHFGCQGLANLAWSFAAGGEAAAAAAAPLFARLAAAALGRAKAMQVQNLVNLAWAFAKLLLAKEGFLDSLAAAAVSKRGELTAQHCSSLCWAFGAVSHVNHGLMTQMAARAVCCISESNPQDLSNLLWSCARLAWNSASFCEALAEEAERKAQEFPVQNLAITSWALGVLRLSRPQLFGEETLQRLREERGRLGAQNLASLAQGLGKQLVRDEGIFSFLATEAAECVDAFSNQELAMVLWAFAKAESAGEVGDSFAASVRRRELMPQDLAVLCWCFAHFAEGSPVLDALSWQVLGCCGEFQAQDLANISWAFATRGRENAVMMAAIAARVRKLGDLQVQDLSNLCWAFAKLGLVDEDLFDFLARHVCDVCESQAADLLPQNVSIISWSFARLALLNQKMMELLAERSQRMLGGLDGQGVANLLWSWAVLALRPASGEGCVGLARRAGELVPEMGAQEMSNVAWGLQILQQAELLQCFLRQAAGPFLRLDRSDGAAWAKFANAAAAVADEAEELKDFFEPVLRRLRRLADGRDDTEETQVSRLGWRYSLEALASLGIGAEEEWRREARLACRLAQSQWQVPTRASVLAYGKWRLFPCGRTSERCCQQLGHVFSSELASTCVGPADVPPAVAEAARGGQAEAAAVLSLLAELEACEAAEVEGEVKLYLCHTPSVACLRLLCELQQTLPRCALSFAFDDAWSGFCGAPR
ncbi:unnamed protein product [Effrenium voratum]|uniref:RNA-editing substrate-binding complex 6 protein domain-containing protein n=1 Tax=Effrenium voratum TaxID=2562239 RepID=A0AA36J3A9_9DINO|nr:unnamed protein product [Effrenium voratum]